jgi:hypothetical protein
VKSVDTVTLQRIYPTLRTAEFVVDLHIPFMNLLLLAAPVMPIVKEFVGRHEARAIRLAHRIGVKSGVLAYELASTVGYKYRIFIGERSYLLAVIPAVLAAVSIAEGKFPRRGLVPPTEHVDHVQLFDAVRSEGITLIAG